MTNAMTADMQQMQLSRNIILLNDIVKYLDYFFKFFLTNLLIYAAHR